MTSVMAINDVSTGQLTLSFSMMTPLHRLPRHHDGAHR